MCICVYSNKNLKSEITKNDEFSECFKRKGPKQMKSSNTSNKDIATL